MKITNERFTTNFTFAELVRNRVNPKGTEYNHKYITKEQYNNLKYKLAPFLQKIRDDVNAKFAEENGSPITIIMTTALRVLEWEHFRGRSGKSYHAKALAGDLKPGNCKNDDMYVKVFHYIMSKYADFVGGVACRMYTYNKGKIATQGFIHIDLRGFRARWNY